MKTITERSNEKVARRGYCVKEPPRDLHS